MSPSSEILYHYKKDRKQRSLLFINMGGMCLFYIAAMYGYEYYVQHSLPEDLRQACLIGFSVASLILFYVAWWHRTHPATYEATLTKERFVIHYPESKQWSFDIPVSEIKRFEYRNTLSHAGKGIGQCGVLMENGDFHEISMNYGNRIKDMHKAIQKLKPDVSFPNKVNLKVSGLINRDYAD